MYRTPEYPKVHIQLFMCNMSPSQHHLPCDLRVRVDARLSGPAGPRAGHGDGRARPLQRPRPRHVRTHLQPLPRRPQREGRHSRTRRQGRAPLQGAGNKSRIVLTFIWMYHFLALVCLLVWHLGTVSSIKLGNVWVFVKLIYRPTQAKNQLFKNLKIV